MMDRKSPPGVSFAEIMDRTGFSYGQLRRLQQKGNGRFIKWRNKWFMHEDDVKTLEARNAWRGSALTI